MASGASWPTAVDYQAALQVPALCFQDPALKCGTITTDALGLPLAATGNVVAVFRMHRDGRDVALRCYTRPADFAALERRYAALEGLAEHIHLPALAPSRFRREEMLVGGERYGLVEMDWVPAQHLHRFIAERLGQAGTLHGLADQWRILVARLQTIRLAHGDLSDGNVLVDDRGRFRLIDFDGIFLPALADVPSGELGKADYQHPERLDASAPGYGHYADNADAFAALVIYLSLRAVAEDPSRWHRYHTGENLIFEAEDFRQPGERPLWQDLDASRDAEVRRLAGVLAEFCQMPVAELPILEEALRRRPSGRLRPAPQKPASAERPGSDLPPAPKWLAVLQEQPAAEEPAAMPVPPLEDDVPPSWWRRRRLASLSAAVVVALVIGVVWISGGRVQHAQSASPPEPVRHLAPAELVGFYTGYATNEEGAREPIALTLDAPRSGEAGAPVLFAYSINWKVYQTAGAGYYDQRTGRLTLDDHYELYVAAATDEEMILASTDHDGPEPLFQVRRRRIR